MKFTLTVRPHGNTLQAMARKPISPFGLTGRLLAPAITVWLSGALCLITCLAVCASSAAACEASSDHSCCERMSQSADADSEPPASISAESVTGASGCCLMFGSRPTVEGPQRHETSIHSESAERFIASVQPAGQDVARYASTLPVRSRGDTYLRCCVFLI